MPTPVQRVVLLMSSFTLSEQLEWTGYQLPIILNYLLSFSIRAALHDVTSIALSAGVLANNALSTALAARIASPRPRPYDAHGLPCREMQSIIFMLAFYIVHAVWWRPHGPTFVALLGATAWAWLALALGGHYFAHQIVAGAVVGAAAGTIWSVLFHSYVIPRAPPLVARWNSFTPCTLHITHAFHYHPGTHCGHPECGGYALHTYTEYAGSELGFDRLLGTLTRLVLIAIIHSQL